MQHNRTAYVILGMLSIEPNKSGYDIRKAVESSVGYFWSESYGQIYPALKRLAADGLIVPNKPAPAPRKRRQEYSLTDAGRACLREWLALPFQNDPPRNEFLLKLFFGREAAPSVSIAHIRELQERNRRMLATLVELETLARIHPSQDPNLPFWTLTLGLGTALTSAALDWGESALAQLAAMEAAAAQNPPPAEGNPAVNEA
ncbi:MAG: PadR family transcriptional regulator [Terracidiphilus sp.]|jgi:DNA-binding PadR family transcriptional regulator